MMVIAIVIAVVIGLFIVLEIVDALWGARCEKCKVKMEYDYDAENERGVYTCPICGEKRYVYYE